MGKLTAASTGASAGASVGEAATAGAGATADTASAIAEINEAAEAENAINLAQTMAQLHEAGPKAMKSLTQG